MTPAERDIVPRALTGHQAVSRRQRWALIAVLAGCAVMRLAIAMFDHGVLWPDEIYQSVEPAHRLAFGNGILAHEFRNGLRSWFFPAQFAPAMALGDALGARTGVDIVIWAKLVMVVYQVLAALGAARLATALRGPAAGTIAALLVTILPVQLLFGSRCMSEVASQTWVVWAAYHMISTRPRSALWAGALLGSAVFVRYQNGAFVLAALGVFAARRNWRDFGKFVGALAFVGTLGGLLDLLTWGSFLHSLVAYVDFNLIHDGAANWGTSPWYFYVDRLVAVMGIMTLALVVGHVAVLGQRTRPVLEILVLELVFLAVHAAIPHKELRFMLPMIPLMAGVAAVGWCDMAARRSVSARARTAWIVGLFATSIMDTARVTYPDVGYALREPWKPGPSAWHRGHDLNRALSYAGSRPNVCGVTVVGAPDWATGGYSYLHRDVPFLVGPSQAAFAASNVLVAVGPMALGPYGILGGFGQVGVAFRSGGCAPIPEDIKRPLQ